MTTALSLGRGKTKLRSRLVGLSLSALLEVEWYPGPIPSGL
jgi:hypothetical protein